MHTQSKRRTNGFTLVEILIVVTILGILAAIVIAGFKPTAETAKANNTYALLKTVRTQLELYKTHHHENYPPLIDLWPQLTEHTTSGGVIDDAGEYGPYLTRPPLNQYTLSEMVVPPGAGTANDGWEYDEDTGQLAAVGFNEKTGEYSTP